jgi:murein DD-endopeptidase MepM/ murein hydrolase activator NlpD
LLILGLLQVSYRQTYSVILNDEVIGYTNDKVTLQKRINDYIKSGDGENVAFVDIKVLPEYKTCLLKKNIDTNDDEIFAKVAASGTAYYKYYAITDENVEKTYVKTFAEAEQIIQSLKDKNSMNKDTIGIVEKFNTVQGEYTDTTAAVNLVYKERPKVTAAKKKATVVMGSNIGTVTVTDLGVTLIKPITSSYTITSRVGGRILNGYENHPGLDIACPTGTAIKAAADGIVTRAGWYGGYGKCIIVQSTSSLNIIYGHCSSLNVTVGQRVAQGQIIGKVGSTGYSTGPHLHFEMRYNGAVVNPQNYVYVGE